VGQSHRIDGDVLLGGLVRVGVAEAHRLEESLRLTDRVAGQAVLSAEFEEKSYEAPLYNQLERGQNRLLVSRRQIGAKEHRKSDIFQSGLHAERRRGQDAANGLDLGDCGFTVASLERR
jgi:hypothetical protein